MGSKLQKLSGNFCVTLSSQTPILDFKKLILILAQHLLKQYFFFSVLVFTAKVFSLQEETLIANLF